MKNGRTIEYETGKRGMNKGRPLFDGKTLNGWHAVPRIPCPLYPGGPEPDKHDPAYQTAAQTRGKWEVRDGAITGAQEQRGFGGYLLTDETFADFELSYEVKPDWPADTGLLVRASPAGTQGFQILLDHRKSGAIGGFYGNGIGGFHAVSFNVDIEQDAAGNAVGIKPEDPSSSLEPVTAEKRALLNYAVTPDTFFKIWRWNDWNEFKVRCEGEYPVLTSWINGVKAYELDTARIIWPNYDREAVHKLLGLSGHIALEVHDNDPRMGDARWAPGNVCRWRNIVIYNLF
ncbi:MAG: DUF1080 domain-containing protein [Treponema sp.]|nr:DUF1080 domain-containing protein [Treponema sp.]